MDEVVQLKMVTGEELLAIYIDEDDDVDQMDVRGVMVIKSVISQASNGMAYYVLKPWLMYHDNPEKIVSINRATIVAVSEPDQILVDQYYKISKVFAELDQEEQPEQDTKQLLVEDKLKQLRDLFKDASNDSDNIVMFPGNDRIN